MENEIMSFTGKWHFAVHGFKDSGIINLLEREKYLQIIHPLKKPKNFHRMVFCD
jgi:hypothetical protein